MNSLDRFQEWLYPELGRFERRLDRQNASLEFQTRLLFRWQVWVAILVFGLIFGLATPMLVHRGILGAGLVNSMVVGALIGLLQATTFLVVFNYLFRQPYRVHLRQRLNALGKPTCIGCGYDLRGQVEPRCPECGRSQHAKWASENSR